MYFNFLLSSWEKIFKKSPTSELHINPPHNLSYKEKQHKLNTSLNNNISDNCPTYKNNCKSQIKISSLRFLG